MTQNGYVQKKEKKKKGMYQITASKYMKQNLTEIKEINIRSNLQKYA